jgi:preflagellin peptidase FlaK
METQIVLDATRVAISLSFLFYASWSDYKTREVSNIVWTLFAPIALALALAELFFFPLSNDLLQTMFWYGICVGLTTAFALILFYAGGFGGADAKALMCIALALPFYPQASFIPLSKQISPTSEIFFPLTIFSNAVILVIVPVLWIVLRNVLWRWRKGKKLFEQEQQAESAGKKILVLITGYKVSINKLKEKWHVYPLEDIEENAESGYRRKLLVLPKDEGRDAIVGRLEKAIQTGTIQDGVWASPGLPMLILVTLGLIVGLFFGDIVWTLVTVLFR